MICVNMMQRKGVPSFAYRSYFTWSYLVTEEITLSWHNKLFFLFETHAQISGKARWAINYTWVIWWKEIWYY